MTEQNTLGFHHFMATNTFGPDSPATKYLEEKIEAAPKGPDEETPNAPGQVIELLAYLHAGGKIH